MGKLPGFTFYPGDWLRDHVSGCSLAAQGLWLRMMILAHDSDRYGYLTMNGTAIPQESIARRCGCTPEQYVTLLAELDAAGVPSRTPEGIIFSRRMVKDDKTRKLTKLRVRKLRSCNADVTHDVTPEYEYENENETVVEVGSKKNKSKPSLEEVIAYCHERNNQVDPVGFFNFYEASGWIRGKTPIKNWKSCVITWERRPQHNGNQQLSKQKSRIIDNAKSIVDAMSGGSVTHGGDDDEQRTNQARNPPLEADTQRLLLQGN